jgi:hypothetical protein
MAHLVALFAVVIYANLGFSERCLAQTGVLETVVNSFCYTNEPVSHLICLLAKRSPILLNAVVDDISDPVLTISEQRATIGDILRELLIHHPGHELHEESGTILVLPKWLSRDESFPLTNRLREFGVTYRSYQSHIDHGETRYWCDFYLPENPELNVGFSPVRVKGEQDHTSFPYVRSFRDRSILEILTAISQENGQSFYCYRMDPADVKARNKSIADRHMGPTWWPKPDAPCYAVIWGTDWSGIRPSQ